MPRETPFGLPVIAAIVIAGGCVGGSVDPPDIVLITVDTLRWDATGFSGAERVATPALDAFANEAMIYDFAHAHAVVTLPSHASILTGLYPYEHRVRDNGGFVLPDDVPTLAGLLRDHGYRTGAVVSAFPLDRRFGLDRGFDHYDDEYEGFAGPSFTPPERPGSESVARAVAWWDANRGAPRFLWLHLFTPHYPYEPAEPHATRYASEPYFGDVAMADEELGPLLERLREGEERDAVVIFTSDHGEGLGDHGETTHGMFAYEETLHVPLVLRAPGRLAPGRSDEPVRHVDLVPTVLELAGVARPAGLPGRSLLGPARAGDESGYFEALSPFLNRGWAPLQGLLQGRVKGISLPISELYDLSSDPGERRNLAPERRRELAILLDGLPDPAAAAGARGSLGREETARLISLGYAAASGAVAREFDASTDPKNLVRYDSMLASALSDFRAGRTENAIRTMRTIATEQPSMALAYTHLSFFLADLGRVEEAIAVLRQAVEGGVANESIRRKLALLLVRAGQADEAWSRLTPHLDSQDPETQTALGRIAAMQGRATEAHDRFQKALQIDPTFPTALMDLGILLMTENRFADARTRLETAVEQDPYLAEAWNGLGVIRSGAGDRAGAIAALRRAVQIDPRMTDALFNLALLLGAAGERDEAAAMLRRLIPLAAGAERTRAEAMLRDLDAGP